MAAKFLYTYKSIALEALKYSTRNSFAKGSPNVYAAARRWGILEEVCSHMPKFIIHTGAKNGKYKWTNEMLRLEALKYSTRNEFKKFSPNAYKAICDRGLLETLCSHMPKHVDQSGENSAVLIWTDEALKLEALKYNTRNEFKKKSESAYQAARKKKILNIICAHMKRSTNGSSPEYELFDNVKKSHPAAIKFIDSKVKILNKKHIHGFEIDIFIPELKRGIEFDGRWHHSYKGLKRSRQHWPDEDIRNYHQLKDDWFATKSITILHIKEQDWINNKEECVKRCFEFLDGGQNG